jgi:hypothetical protein
VRRTGTPCCGCSNPRSDRLRCAWSCPSSSYRSSSSYCLSVVGVARFPPPGRRAPRHRSEQYFTSSQTVFHFLRH